MRIEDSTTVITGASSGIGRAAARELAKGKANLVLAARSKDNLKALAAELASFPGRCLVVPTDVTDRLAVEALVRKTAEEFGSVDILINNAGVGLFAPIADGNLENMQRLFNVNFWGAINCIQAAVPYMQAQQRGHIVNVSSIAGRISPPYMGIYSATKFALTAISDSLRAELSGSGIGVSTIFPGLTETNFMENMTQEVDAPAIPPVARFASASVVGTRIVQSIRYGLRDVYVSPEDVAAVALNTFAPQLTDWAMRMFLRPVSRENTEISLPKPEPPRKRATAETEPPAEAS